MLTFCYIAAEEADGWKAVLVADLATAKGLIPVVPIGLAATRGEEARRACLGLIADKVRSVLWVVQPEDGSTVLEVHLWRHRGRRPAFEKKWSQWQLDIQETGVPPVKRFN